MSKRQTRIYRSIIIITAILGIGGLLFYRLYFEPYQYKKKLFVELKETPDLQQYPDSTLWSFVDCLYEKSIDEYGSIKNFPENTGVMDLEYYKLFLHCQACNFYEDSMKNFILNNIDSLVLETIKYQNQKLN